MSRKHPVKRFGFSGVFLRHARNSTEVFLRHARNSTEVFLRHARNSTEVFLRHARNSIDSKIVHKAHTSSCSLHTRAPLRPALVEASSPRLELEANTS
ncbi:hypothetical protein J6590_069430 [Homalodisca vitripennis]|nr:hypothetical protein J6590_069430 [Homalodisca vitripennis]